jgi:hypothetical protein
MSIHHPTLKVLNIYLCFLIRYNGQIPNGDRGRRRSKFQLRQRTQANGLKAQRQHLCKNADEVQVRKTKFDTTYSQGYSLILNCL